MLFCCREVFLYEKPGFLAPRECLQRTKSPSGAELSARRALLFQRWASGALVLDAEAHELENRISQNVTALLEAL